MNREQAKNLIIETFENPFNEDNFVKFIVNLVKSYDRTKALKPRSGIQGITQKYLDFIDSWERIGRYEVNGKIIDILVVKLKKRFPYIVLVLAREILLLIICVGISAQKHKKMQHSLLMFLQIVKIGDFPL